MPARPRPFSLQRRRILLALAASALARPAWSQPAATPVTLIVPAAASGSADVIARLLADALADVLEVPVRVENIPGNGGVTGTLAIKNAPADGSVIGLALSTPIVAGKLLSRSAQFNPSEDFDWLGVIATYPNAVVLPSRSNYTTHESWLEAARKATPPMTYGSPGPGSPAHLAGAYLRYEQGAHLVHRALATQDEGYAMLSDGRLDVLFDGLPNALKETARSGHRIVAVTAPGRVASLPDVPAYGDLYHQSFVVWAGLIAPRRLPPATYSRLASAIGVLLGQPKHAEGLRALGLTFLGLTGPAARAYIEDDILRQARLIARLNDEGVRQ
ncbi:MAG: tripartite tricarboxylate transporter substrate binding protein [Burkholderiales bacterium]